jgi:hypothetical protein
MKYYTKVSGVYLDGLIKVKLSAETAKKLQLGDKFFCKIFGIEETGTIIDVYGLDLVSGLYNLDLKFNKKIKGIKNEKIIIVNVATSSVSSVIQIPLDAIIFENKDVFVWVVDENKKVTKRKIKIKDDNGQEAQIQSGLKVDELIVVNGFLDLKENDLVRVHKIIEVKD